MTSAWHDFLIERGALVEADTVRHFGDAAAELRAARDAGVIVPLTHLGLIACSGEDTQTFLHGQLSNDVKMLAPERSEYAAYCSAKGRMLANFLVWRDDQAYCLQLARSLLPAIQKRLAMYVMRAKVKLADVSESRLILGLSGNGARDALRAFFPALPQEVHELIHDPAIGTLIALPGNRFQLIAEPESARRLWRKLAQTLTPAGTPCWEWLEIRSGIPLLTPATQEQFVPQMANMEIIGAINFKKGCYPGQEIVARMQYLGKLKERLFRLHVDGDPPSPGTPLYSSVFGEQACGTVVNAASAPGGGSDLLAVVQRDAAAGASLRLGTTGGPVLTLLDLPYVVPAQVAPQRPKLA
jgi:folate-binding protein YgfZ